MGQKGRGEDGKAGEDREGMEGREAEGREGERRGRREGNRSGEYMSRTTFTTVSASMILATPLNNVKVQKHLHVINFMCFVGLRMRKIDETHELWEDKFLSQLPTPHYCCLMGYNP